MEMEDRVEEDGTKSTTLDVAGEEAEEEWKEEEEEEGEDGEDLAYLPEPPEEPLPTDCCGTGCSPCVRDIFEAELEEWQRLKAMTPRERAEWRSAKMAGASSRDRDLEGLVAVSPTEYRSFTVERIQQLSKDSLLFSFAMPASHKLGLSVGQHIVLR